MRLTVRKEQLDVMEAYSQENFVRRIAARLVSGFSESAVKLPDGTEHRVADIPEDRLLELIRSGVAKARSYGMTFESAIAGFVILMFDVSPNFDGHRLCQVLLTDEETAPNKRIEELVSVLSDEKWESIRKDYDPAAWESAPEPETADSGAEPTPDTAPKPEASADGDFDATVRVEKKEQ